MKLSNKAYDTLRWVLTLVVPALVALIGTTFPIFGIAPETTANVSTVITALSLAVGTVFNISNATYRHEQEDKE